MNIWFCKSAKYTQFIAELYSILLCTTHLAKCVNCESVPIFVLGESYHSLGQSCGGKLSQIVRYSYCVVVVVVVVVAGQW